MAAQVLLKWYLLLAITYANPHVYLDTVVLLGSISVNFNDKMYFGLGAIFSSFIFFFSIGYFSNYLSKYIQSKKIWFYIDNIMGFLMLFYGLFLFSCSRKLLISTANIINIIFIENYWWFNFDYIIIRAISTQKNAL